MFYRGYKGNPLECTAVHMELERLKSITNEQQHEEFHVAYFCNRSAMKGLGIGIALTMFTALTANFPLMNYAVLMFAKVGTTIDPYNASIMLAVALILGSLTTTYLADILGRKMLNFISLLGSAVGLFSTALFYYLHSIGFDLSAYAWVPIFCLSLVIFISSAGIVQLSLICSVEYLPAKVRFIKCFVLITLQNTLKRSDSFQVRTYGIAIISCSLSLANFVCGKIFPILVESIDVHGCLIVFGVGCTIGFLFVLLCLKETSGQSLDDVGVKQRRWQESESGERLDRIL